MEVIANVHYDKIAEIGGSAGQNSHVYRAFDHHLNTELVVKEIEKTRIGDPKRYFQEASTIHASAHSRVVSIYWAAETGDCVCIAMPLMAGGSLADLIKLKPLKPSRLIEVAQDICEGIAQVHLAKFVHLDIKPTNVLFDSDGRASIADFGQALRLDSYGSVDARSQPLYYSFTPPEVFRDKGVVTQASDVYQIGLTLYRALTGESYFKKQWKDVTSQPWPFARNAILSGAFPDRSFPPYAPLGLRRAILRALDVDPQKRQVSSRSLAGELADVQIRHDWEMIDQIDSDVTAWRLRQRGRTDTLVVQRGRLPSVEIEIWTESSTGRRRKCREAWQKRVKTERLLKKALVQAFRAAVV
jgi:serine/threonine protein kinase